MKTHYERVSELHSQARLMHEEKIRRIRNEHTIRVTCVLAIPVVFCLIGAYIPGFYRWLDSMHPITQLVTVLVPIGAFAFWRLKKMIKI